MTVGPLCLSCGYWVATIGDQCDTCRGGDPAAGLEAAVVASAIVWRRRLGPLARVGADPTVSALIDSVDRMLEAGW
jgi:hypothetical protein